MGTVWGTMDVGGKPSPSSWNPWNYTKKKSHCWNPKCIPFWLYPIQSSGLLCAGAKQALHFFPSYQFYSSFISQSWEEQIWIVAAVRWMKAANGGPAHTWPHNLTSESAFSRWREGRLGQIATQKHNGCLPSEAVATSQFWAAKLKGRYQLWLTADWLKREQYHQGKLIVCSLSHRPHAMMSANKNYKARTCLPKGWFWTALFETRPSSKFWNFSKKGFKKAKMGKIALNFWSINIRRKTAGDFDKKIKAFHYSSDSTTHLTELILKYQKHQTRGRVFEQSLDALESSSKGTPPQKFPRGGGSSQFPKPLF